MSIDPIKVTNDAEAQQCIKQPLFVLGVGEDGRVLAFFTLAAMQAFYLSPAAIRLVERALRMVLDEHLPRIIAESPHVKENPS